MAFCTDVFVVGAVKSGTTSLVEYLSGKEGIFVPAMKEPFYFVSDDIGLCELGEYEQIYTCAEEGDIKVDASTGYLFDGEAASKIYAHNKKAKIVIVLRSPVRMCYSLWQYMNVDGIEYRSFSESIRDIRIPSNNVAGWKMNYSYLERGLYAKQIKRYLELFDEVLILVFEEMVLEPAGTLRRLDEFLGVPAEKSPVLPRTNIGGSVNNRLLHRIRNSRYPTLKRIFPANLRARIRYTLRDWNTSKKNLGEELIGTEDIAFLVDYYKDDVRELREMGVDVSRWKDFDVNAL